MTCKQAQTSQGKAMMLQTAILKCQDKEHPNTAEVAMARTRSVDDEPTMRTYGKCNPTTCGSSQGMNHHQSIEKRVCFRFCFSQAFDTVQQPLAFFQQGYMKQVEALSMCQ